MITWSPGTSSIACFGDCKMKKLDEDAKAGHPIILAEASIDEEVQKC